MKCKCAEISGAPLSSLADFIAWYRAQPQLVQYRLMGKAGFSVAYSNHLQLQRKAAVRYGLPPQATVEEILFVFAQGQPVRKRSSTPRKKAPKAKPKYTAEPLDAGAACFAQLIPLSQIHEARHLFQNREKEFSQESVDRILAAVQEGRFYWEVMDPILLWRNPADRKLYILSGHSRTQAFRQLADLGARAQGQSFAAIPAKIIDVPLEEAQRIALNSNSLATKEKDLERARYYRGLRSSGTSARAVEKQAKELEGKNATYVLNLSYLNPAGSAWAALTALSEGEEGTNKQILQTIADWTGEARRKVPDLSDGHEEEIYRWLSGGAYGNRSGQIASKAEFFGRLLPLVDRARNFGLLDQALNLENRMVKSPVEAEYDSQLTAAKREYDEAKKALDDKRAELTRRRATEADKGRILLPMEAAVRRTLERYTDLVNRRDDVKAASRAQATIFGLDELGFEWDAGNQRKLGDYKGRGFSIEDVELALADPEAFCYRVENVRGEERQTILCDLVDGQLAVVILTIRNERYRVISFLRSSRKSYIRAYEQARKNRD